jgi:hypothetical protein
MNKIKKWLLSKMLTKEDYRKLFLRAEEIKCQCGYTILAYCVDKKELEGISFTCPCCDSNQIYARLSTAESVTNGDPIRIITE